MATSANYIAQLHLHRRDDVMSRWACDVCSCSVRDGAIGAYLGCVQIVGMLVALYQ